MLGELFAAARTTVAGKFGMSFEEIRQGRAMNVKQRRGFGD
jgi:hypothetical protein